MNSSSQFILNLVRILGTMHPNKTYRILEIGTGGQDLVPRIMITLNDVRPEIKAEAWTIDPTNSPHKTQLPNGPVEFFKGTSLQFVKERKAVAPIDLLLIDGCHTFNVVFWELQLFVSAGTKCLLHDTMPPYGFANSPEYNDDDYPALELPDNYEGPTQGVRLAVDAFLAEYPSAHFSELGPHAGNPYGLGFLSA